MSRNKRLTAVDVARRAGVSQATVSRVLAGRANVSPRTKERVLKAASDLGYHTNAIARSLITRRTGLVGIVATEMTNPFYPEVIERFAKQLGDRGFRVLFAITEHDPVEYEDISVLMEYRVDGIIVPAATLSSAIVELILASGTPVVLFNRYVRDMPCSFVSCDNVGGGRLVARHLVQSQGRKRPAFITGKSNTSTSVDRKAGFLRELEGLGIGQVRVAEGNYTYEGGFAAAKILVNQGEPPDSIFCANDITAIGAIDALREMNILVPDEISVVGFDDIGIAKWPAYLLSTVSQPIDAMIDATIEILVSQVNHPETPPTQLFIPGQLIQRRSG